MVHLSPDSRLLVSLVKQDQAYSAQLHNLLTASGASLSALAVYASSSPPTVSHTLNGVASALSGADEALRDYGEAVNDWIDQLRSVKTKEEQVANIGRDREILVTRLVKASQKSKSPPPSLLHSAPDTASNSSFPTFSSKVTTAQAELQACEAHLADQERELERVRIHAISHGLKLRCDALVRCGWVWGEMGRRALSMLGELNNTPPPENGHASSFFKPLPNPTHDHDHESALSSVTPSQSASQIGVITSPISSYLLDIPPPHLVSEHTAIPRPSRDVRDESTSSEEEGPVEVHENPRFQSSPILHRQKTARTAPPSPIRASFRSPSAPSDIGSPARTKPAKDRKGPGLLGSIALLFRTSMHSKSSSPSGGQWSTRTDHNLRNIKSEGEESDDDDPQPRSGRLRRGKTRASTTDVENDPHVVPPLPIPSSSAAAPSRKKKTGGLTRGSTVRSTLSEPAGTPRARAHTLTSSSSTIVPVSAQSGTSRTQTRRASLEGKWGTEPSMQTWKPPKHAMNGTSGSLMSIVEGVGVSHRAQTQTQNGDPSTSAKLEIVRAPGSQIAGLPLLIHPPPPVSLSAPASPSYAHKRASLPPVLPSRSTPPPALGPHLIPEKVREKKPLRSALRDPNRGRSVSPVPSGSNTNTAPSEEAPRFALPSASPSHRDASTSRPGIPGTIVESSRQSLVGAGATVRPQSPGDESASISSYETGHENFEDAELEPSPPKPPPANEKVKVKTKPTLSRLPLEVQAPPPLTAPNGIAVTGNSAIHEAELSSAASTDTATGFPMRRKSVRMSALPPQVSATPPALEEYEDEDRAPWGREKGEGRRGRKAGTVISTASGEISGQVGTASGLEGWKTRIPTRNIAWDDSSSEEEEYKAARKALSRIEQHGSGVKKR
ncbi:hypothetical protein K439DRAFT_1418705 [Ramaria rubella]|nr:hypothetical protein K439DRAFT_1418705 [Ramaria rubella]